MVPLLLLIIIAILLFGSAKFLGAVGAILGAILSIGIITYVAVHYELSGWAVIGIISVPVVALLAFGIWDDLDKKRTTLKIEADGWEQITRTLSISGSSEEEFLVKYPDWRKRRDAWQKLNKKTPRA